jgi:hypothetical protein
MQRGRRQRVAKGYHAQEVGTRAGMQKDVKCVIQRKRGDAAGICKLQSLISAQAILLATRPPLPKHAIHGALAAAVYSPRGRVLSWPALLIFEGAPAGHRAPMPNDSAWSGVRLDRPHAKASCRARYELFAFRTHSTEYSTPLIRRNPNLLIFQWGCYARRDAMTKGLP